MSVIAGQQQDFIKKLQESLQSGIGDVRGIYGGARERSEGLFGQASDLLSNLGNTARTRAKRGATEGFAADTQSLIGRGLYNTTALDATRRTRGRDLEEANQAIDEQVGAQRAGVLERQAGAGTGIDLGEAGFLGGQLPRQELIAQLLQSLGQSGQTGRGSSNTVFGGVPSSGGGLYGGSGGGGGGSGGGGGGGGSTYGGGGSGGSGGTQGGRVTTTRGSDAQGGFNFGSNTKSQAFSPGPGWSNTGSTPNGVPIWTWMGGGAAPQGQRYF